MSKPWFAFFKRAAVSVGVSAFLAFSVVAGDAVSLPEREVVLSANGGRPLRVGDSVSYTLEGAGGDSGAEARWGIDPKQGGLKLGFLFRPIRLFTPLAAGELSLPALPVLDEKGEVVARTKPISVTIASNLSEQERNSGQPPKPEPALGPLGLPFPAWIQSVIGFSILGVVLVGVFFLMRYLRRKAAAALKKILPKKPYDVAALERMDALLKRELRGRADFRAFYFEISETLKGYLGDRFDFDARESTSSELVVLLRERNGAPGLNDRIIDRVKVLFDSLDPVKFADVVPTVEEANGAHRETRELITSTRKVEMGSR